MKAYERVVEHFRQHSLAWAFAVMVILLALVSALAQQKRMHIPYEDICVTGLNELDHIRSLSLQAIDTSFREHIQKLFDYWLADPQKQPERAAAGFKKAVHAYRRARGNAISWNPPICKEGQQ
jgi:hypothetical protein